MAFDIYLVISGAPGESAVGGLADINGRTVQGVPCEVYSFSWGESNPVTIGSPPGKPFPTSLNLMKRTDRASVPLLRTSLKGASFPSASLYLRRTIAQTPQVFEQYDLGTVYVDSIQWSGSSGGDDVPTESVSLAFVTIKMSYASQNPDGTRGAVQTVMYDQAKNVVT